MNTKDLAGKVCWITGASSGIGAALAVELSKLDSTLILSSRRADKLEEVKAACTKPKKVVVLPFDMEDTRNLAGIARKAWDVNGGIDFVFLNAGLAVRDWLIHTEQEWLEKVMRVNFFSAAAITKTLVPLMKDRGAGCFVVTSSLSGKYGIPKLSAYSASKHALHGYFETLRTEHARDGIKVIMVVPGLVKTDITLHAFTGNGTVNGKMQEAIANGISAEACAQGMIRAVVSGRNEVLIGGVETYSVMLKRLFPGWFDAIIRNNPMKKIRSLSFRRNT